MSALAKAPVITSAPRTGCILCMVGVVSQRLAYTYSWGAAQGCALHRSLWEQADQHAHRGGECPFTPARCPRVGCHSRSEQ